MSTPKRKRRSPSLYIPPEFVSWLSNNYMVNPEESVPKDSIYRRYVQHCREMDIAPKKSNIFGKMLKKMFPNIRPRRLGSAGNMVAHYAGITLRQPGRPLPPSTPEEVRRSQRYRRHSVSSCSSGASSPNSAFSPQTPRIQLDDEDDEDECDEDDDYSAYSSSFSDEEDNSPTSAASPTTASSCSTYPSLQQQQQRSQQTHYNMHQPSCHSAPSPDPSAQFSSHQFSFYPPGSFAPAATLAYHSPNHSFLSSLHSGIQADEGVGDIFQVRSHVFEEKETVEEEEFEGLSMLNFPLDDNSKTFKHSDDDFAHLIVNGSGELKTEKQEPEHGESSDNKNMETNTHPQENSAQEREDIAMMLSSSAHEEGIKDELHQDQQKNNAQEGNQQQQQQSGQGETHAEAGATAEGTIQQTTTTQNSTEPAMQAPVGVNPFAVVMPPQMLMVGHDESGEGNESDGNLIPPFMRMTLEQQQQQLNQQRSTMSELHQSQLSQLKKYMCIFLRQVWIYAPIANRVMDDRNVEYYILSEEGRKEQSVRSLCVKFALYMGSLYCENFDHAKEFYLATRDTLSFVFDVLDLDVAWVMLFMSHTASHWYDKEEADALAFNYISAALSLCQAAKAFHTEVYRKCVEYEGWLALRTGPAGQPPLRPYHPPPAHYKVVGKPQTNPPMPIDSQMVIDDTISILINVMNTLKFFELYAPSSPAVCSSPSSSSSAGLSSPQTMRKTRSMSGAITSSPSSSPSMSGQPPQQIKPQQPQQGGVGDDDPRLLKLKDNMRILQKQLELCYNTICQVEASGGYSFEAAFRPKFWLISIVSSVHLTMGEREKGMNAALLAVKSLEKWLSLSGSLWGCGVMFDYIAQSLDQVGDEVNLEFFVSLIEKQKYCAAKSTQAFVNKWRKRLADRS